MENKKETSWGKVSSWYDELLEVDEDSYQRTLILPNMMRLLAPKKGMSVLDLACGQGFFAREFAVAGAAVTGVDVSPELIEIAKKRTGNGATFNVASADDLKDTHEASFDAVTIILALQNIENLNGTLAECCRVIKPNGRLLVVLNHPTFRIPKKSSWVFDEKNQIQYRRIDEYISESRVSIEMEPGRQNGRSTRSFHRPLQTYFKALQKNNFYVTRLEEWVSQKKSGPGPRASGLRAG